ncbi:SAM hydrolase/SAM-dependent halogenase family protein [Actinopolyspora sp. H202]|uniref:SAM hydrolase/SAM-dependent halogenase family protein n=1 Tax=Actinopolyspora sp. H202 TaxID=1500456 RepID=UPI003EE67247
MNDQPRHPWISFTTDYGTADGFVAACRGVLARHAPAVSVIDISHHIPPQAITAASAVLTQTVPYLPTAVHLVVVDPGVGTARRGLALETTSGSLLVGPDNGVLLAPAERLGGITTAVELAEPDWWLPEVSATFHGRDIFAPVAAAAALGADIRAAGPALTREQLVPAPTPHSSSHGRNVRAQVITIDHFGNLQLALPATQAPWHHGEPLLITTPTGRFTARFGRTFGDVAEGDCLVLADSAGHLAVAVNTASAAARLETTRDHILDITPAERDT